MNALIIFSAQYLYLLVIAITAVCFFIIPKDQKRNFGLLLIIALPCIYLISKVAANFYFDPRPFVVGHFAPLIPHAPDNGFPSDHVLLTSAISSVVFAYNKKVSAVLWALTIIVGLARILVGVHHLIDIAGAITISILVTAVIDYLLKKQKVFIYRYKTLTGRIIL
ncbi:MAG: phosphatase PAP2 family protein [Candidatus Doudnabacteria bacterium]|nr:phosphatase PAP2 family protein [Candidatus Doudnabacteria bacterium]